ncbi:hypothetical protein UT300018_25880 [Clostridium faecium]
MDVRILIIEDEKYMAEAIEQVLKKNKYSILKKLLLLPMLF